MAGSGIGGFGSGTSAMNGARGASLSIDVRGMDSLQAGFRQRMAGLEGRMSAVTYKIAQDIAEVARDIVAYDTGKTSQNIVAKRGRGESIVSATRGGERDVVPAYLELGTHKMAARPFMKPAGEMAIAAGATKEALREVGGLLSSSII